MRAVGLHVHDTSYYVETFGIHLLVYVCIDLKDSHANLDKTEPFAPESCLFSRYEPYVEAGQVCLQRCVFLVDDP